MTAFRPLSRAFATLVAVVLTVLAVSVLAAAAHAAPAAADRSAAPTAPNARAADEAADFVSRINGLRADKGLRQLSVDGSVEPVTARWTDRMVRGRSGSPTTRTSPTRSRATGRGPARTSAWATTSPASCRRSSTAPATTRNLVDPDWTHVAVSVRSRRRRQALHHPRVHATRRRPRRHPTTATAAPGAGPEPVAVARADTDPAARRHHHDHGTARHRPRRLPIPAASPPSSAALRRMACLSRLGRPRGRPAMPVIETHDLTRQFPSGTAVDGLTPRPRSGEVLALLGPNGAGKTTTVRLLNGVLQPRRRLGRVLGLDPVTQGDELRGPHRRPHRARRSRRPAHRPREPRLHGAHPWPRAARRALSSGRRAARAVRHGRPRRRGRAGLLDGPTQALAARPGRCSTTPRSCSSTSRRRASTPPRPETSST